MPILAPLRKTTSLGEVMDTPKLWVQPLNIINYFLRTFLPRPDQKNPDDRHTELTPTLHPTCSCGRALQGIIESVIIGFLLAAFAFSFLQPLCYINPARSITSSTRWNSCCFAAATLQRVKHNVAASFAGELPACPDFAANTPPRRIDVVDLEDKLSFFAIPLLHLGCGQAGILLVAWIPWCCS